MITVESFSETCRALPHAEEDVKWGSDLVFSIREKMFAAVGLEEEFGAGFKCSPEDFAGLTERPGIAPSKYLARAFWVTVTDPTALSEDELREYVRRSYELVRSKLPKKLQAELTN